MAITAGWAAALLLASHLGAAVIVVENGCTLEDAIDSANTDQGVGDCIAGDPGHDTVQLTESLVLTEQTTTIRSSLTIDGQGFAVRRDETAPSFGVFTLSLDDPDHLVAMKALTINGGDAPFGGGGIRNTSGTLLLVDTEVSDNSAKSQGGGVFSLGTTVLLNSTVSGNSTGVGSNNYYSYGGGIYIHAGYGPGSLLLVDSTVSNNRANAFGSIEAHGGGIASGGIRSGGPVTVMNSTISDNIVETVGFSYVSYGGGIRQGAAPLLIVNSTLSNNAVDGVRDGGAIFSSGPTQILHSAIVDNSPNGVSSAFGPVTLVGSLMANGSESCDGAGDFIDGGGNFADEVGDCPGAELLVGLDRNLADNGGTTETHALLPGSSAIDARDGCSLIPDQRGFTRDSSCDSGPVEFAAPAPPDLQIAVAGTCPGEVQAEATGAVPGSQVSFVLSAGEGALVFSDSRNCPGTYLDRGILQSFQNRTADANGRASITVELAQGECGATIQVVDRDSCSASSGVAIP